MKLFPEAMTLIIQEVIRKRFDYMLVDYMLVDYMLVDYMLRILL